MDVAKILTLGCFGQKLRKILRESCWRLVWKIIKKTFQIEMQERRQPQSRGGGPDTASTLSRGSLLGNASHVLEVIRQCSPLASKVWTIAALTISFLPVRFLWIVTRQFLKFKIFYKQRLLSAVYGYFSWMRYKMVHSCLASAFTDSKFCTGTCTFLSTRVTSKWYGAMNFMQFSRVSEILRGI